MDYILTLQDVNPADLEALEKILKKYAIGGIGIREKRTVKRDDSARKKAYERCSCGHIKPKGKKCPYGERQKK